MSAPLDGKALERAIDGAEEGRGPIERVESPFPPLRWTRLDEETVGEHVDVRELDGGASAGGGRPHPVPVRAPRRRRRRGDRDDLRDPTGTVFDTDDRYLYLDLSFPWGIVGKIRTAGGAWGSGTLIGPRHVLTASHCVDWPEDGDGDPGWATFTPGYYDGRGPVGEIPLTEVISWTRVTGLATDLETAFDYAVLTMDEPLGERLGYAGARTYDSAWEGGDFWQYTGYPGELASGERPAFQGRSVISSRADHSLSGQTGCVLGHFNEFTPGQSGGAAWGWWADEPWPRVVGVGSTIGSTAVEEAHGSTTGDNEYGGGPALTALISWARANRP